MSLTCNQCKETVNKLYKGICVKCISKRSRENEGIEENNSLTANMGGDWLSIIKKAAIIHVRQEEEKRKQEENKLENGISEEDRALNHLMRDIGIKVEKYPIYKATVKELVKKHILGFENGDYKLCQMIHYGVKCGGTLIDQKRGIGVYSKVEYIG